jgi:bifunctional protein glmU
VIGEDCRIGPNVRFQDMVIGDNVKAHYVYAHDAEVESGTDLGQFNHIRPDSRIGAGVKIGNFVEVKNSNVGAGTKLPHLSYIGDCDLGAHVNMGCGTITVNYDGKHKYRTVIEDNAFVGCNSNLVAPVTVGENAYVAAGSTITRDVPSGTLSVARARQKEIEGWHDKRK